MLTATNIHNDATGVPTHSPAPTNQDNQTTQNIVFGVFAIVLALVAIFIGWLQLRSFQRKESDEEIAVGQPRYELVEI
jgi:hypothetical protein